jgi:PTH2 family peptidyl-tRNA hydrolase
VEHKQVIILRKDLNMRKGKLVAQGAHASMGAILKQMTVTADNKMVLDLNDARLAPWVTGRFKKICVYVNSEQELLDLHKQATEAGLITSLILDAGLTEFGGVSTYTAVGIGPDSEDKIDAVCKHLPLF